MSASPPTRIGPYQILGSLGAGGMGEVYRARDTRLGRELALKILPSDKSGSRERRQRFIQEAQAASSLNHPNIVTIYDIGSDEGLDYIAMEYIQGQTLDQLIPRKGLRLSQALAYAIPIADALARAHAAGIVHRDLKPSNVMVGQDGVVKLLDFGIAKLTEPTPSTGESATFTAALGSPRTAEGVVVGTASYMSPEQAESTDVDARSDVFSFGAVLYEMLTGERAFQGSSAVSTLSSVLKEEPKPIRTVTEGVPPELERVVARCLRKDRAKRWQSMTDLKVALAELKEETDSGALVTATAGLGAAGRKRRMTWPLWAAGALVVVAAAFGWWRSGGPWTGATALPAASSGAAAEGVAPEIMTNDDVIRMVRAGLSPALIADHIRASRTNFDIQTAELIRLSESGVPEAIIGVMRQPQAAGAGPGQRQNQNLRVVKLSEGQALQLVLMQDLTAGNPSPGDRLRLSVAQAVTVDGQVAIKKGAPVSGTIVEVEKKKFYRRHPKITIRLGQVTAVDGQELRLRAKAARGGSDVLSVTAKDSAGAGQGTLLDAYLDESREVGGPAPPAGAVGAR